MGSIPENLLWIEKLLPPDVYMSPVHGGYGYYIDSRLVLILVDHPESTHEHKGVVYPFDLWKGCIFPIEKIKQNAFFLKYLFLENHPGNKNWLYIPADSENFEDEVKMMVREIAKKNPLLGIAAKIKAPAKAKAEVQKKKTKTPKKIKADKKRENAFILGMVKRKVL